MLPMGNALVICKIKKIVENNEHLICECVCDMTWGDKFNCSAFTFGHFPKYWSFSMSVMFSNSGCIFFFFTTLLYHFSISNTLTSLVKHFFFTKVVYPHPPSRWHPHKHTHTTKGVFLLFWENVYFSEPGIWGMRWGSVVLIRPLVGHSGSRVSPLWQQLCLCRPFSTARFCSLSLYIVKAFLNLGSFTVLR